MELTPRKRGGDGEVTFTHPPVSQHTQWFRSEDAVGLDAQLHEFIYGLAVRVVTMTAYYAPGSVKPHKLLVVFERER